MLPLVGCRVVCRGGARCFRLSRRRCWSFFSIAIRCSCVYWRWWLIVELKERRGLSRLLLLWRLFWCRRDWRILLFAWRLVLVRVKRERIVSYFWACRLMLWAVLLGEQSHMWLLGLRDSWWCLLIAERPTDTLEHWRMNRWRALNEMCWHLGVLLSGRQAAWASSGYGSWAAIRKWFSWLFWLAPQRDLLLFEVATILGVHQYEIEEIPDWELLVDVTHRRRQVVASKKHANWNAFAFDGCAVHYFIFSYRLVLGEDIWA